MAPAVGNVQSSWVAGSQRARPVPTAQVAVGARVVIAVARTGGMHSSTEPSLAQPVAWVKASLSARQPAH